MTNVWQDSWSRPVGNLGRRFVWGLAGRLAGKWRLTRKLRRARETAQEIFPLYLNIARRLGWGRSHHMSMDIEVSTILFV